VKRTSVGGPMGKEEPFQLKRCMHASVSVYKMVLWIIMRLFGPWLLRRAISSSVCVVGRCAGTTSGLI
jgi:hypothetical protein